jgi:hypothetical protein
MSRDHNDIYSIVDRLRALEESLDSNQKSVNQLGATFKPKTVAVLTAKTDPKNPLAGKLVGGCEESQELEEAVATEDVLDRVKKSFAEYLSNIADEIKSDTDLKSKTTGDSDIKAKSKTDRALVSKAPKMAEDGELDAAMSGIVPAAQPAGEPGVSMKESVPVKTVAMECGGNCEIHGDDHAGYEVRRQGRSLPTRFSNQADAEMAIHMYNQRGQQQNDAQDYVDEA